MHDLAAPALKESPEVSALNRTIDALQPGQSVYISGDSKYWVEVERSGDGQTLRFVRFTPNSSEVFHTAKF